MTFADELAVALQAAQLASEYILQEYRLFTPIPDATVSLSTHVDHQAQEVILQHLHAAYPLDALIAEERTSTLERSPVNTERIWIVDPIDGTRGFAMKNGEFSVMIGLVVAGRVVVGVVQEPVPDRVTYARRGGGCWVQREGTAPEPCEVSSKSQLEQASLVQSRSKPGSGPKIGERLLQPQMLVETYSAGIKLAMVARGEVEIYVNDYRDFHDWDVCAGQLLVEEAGGRVTLLNGEPIIYGTRGQQRRDGLIATNGRLHDECLFRLSYQSE